MLRGSASLCGSFDRLMRQVDRLTEDVHVATGIVGAHTVLGSDDIPVPLGLADQFACFGERRRVGACVSLAWC